MNRISITFDDLPEGVNGIRDGLIYSALSEEYQDHIIKRHMLAMG